MIQFPHHLLWSEWPHLCYLPECGRFSANAIEQFWMGKCIRLPQSSLREYHTELSCTRVGNKVEQDHLSAGERPYKCHLPECGRAFIQLSNLQQHLRNHDAQVERAKNRPFHCNICGKGFATESSLRTHTSKVSANSCYNNSLRISVS